MGLWKQKESQWIKDQNQLEGSKRIIEELSTKIIELGKDKKDCRVRKRIANARIEQLMKSRNVMRVKDLQQFLSKFTEQASGTRQGNATFECSYFC